MNDLDLCLEVASRSCHPLRYIQRKLLQIEAWFQRTTNRKWHMGYQMVTWPMTSRDPEMCCEAVRSDILATAWLLVLVYFVQMLVVLLRGCLGFCVVVVFSFVNVSRVIGWEGRVLFSTSLRLDSEMTLNMWSRMLRSVYCSCVGRCSC